LSSCFEYSQKSLSHFAQEIGISESSAPTATGLPKLKPSKPTMGHASKPHDPTNRVNFFNWILHCVHDGEIDHQLIFFDDKA
jgi:hypothetical protein